MANYGARLEGYPVAGLEGYRREKPVASRGRCNLLPADGAIPRFGRAGFGLRSGRESSRYDEKRPVAVGYASAINLKLIGDELQQLVSASHKSLGLGAIIGKIGWLK